MADQRPKLPIPTAEDIKKFKATETVEKKKPMASPSVLEKPAVSSVTQKTPPVTPSASPAPTPVNTLSDFLKGDEYGAPGRLNPALDLWRPRTSFLPGEGKWQYIEARNEGIARSQNPSPNELPKEPNATQPSVSVTGSQGKLLIPERKEKFPAVTETVTTFRKVPVVAPSKETKNLPLNPELMLQAIAGNERGKLGELTKVKSKSGAPNTARGTYQITEGTLETIFNKDANFKKSYDNFNQFKKDFNTNPDVEHQAALSHMMDLVETHGINALLAWFSPTHAARAAAGDKKALKEIPGRSAGNTTTAGNYYNSALSKYRSLLGKQPDQQKMVNVPIKKEVIREPAVEVPSLEKFNVLSPNYYGGYISKEEKPKEPTTKKVGALENIYNNFLSSTSRLAAGIAGLPNAANKAALMVTTKLLGIDDEYNALPVQAKKEVGNVIATITESRLPSSSVSSEVQDYLIKKSDEFLENTNKSDKYLNERFVDFFKAPSVDKATDLFSEFPAGFAGSLPYMINPMLGAVSAASEQYDQDIKEAGGKLGWGQIINAGVTGISEYYVERISNGILNRSIASALGRPKVALDLAKGFIKSVLKDVGMEGASEAVTQFAQSISDDITKGREINWIKTANETIDAAITGAGIAGGMRTTGAGIGYLAKKVMTVSEKNKVNRNTSAMMDLHSKKGPDNSPEVNLVIDSKIKELDDENKNIINSNINKVNSLSDDQLKGIVDIDNGISNIYKQRDAIVSNENLDDEEKQSLLDYLKSQVKTLNEQKDAIQKQATSEVPIQPEAGASLQMAEGEPQAEPQIPTEEGQEVEPAIAAVDITTPTQFKDGEMPEIPIDQIDWEASGMGSMQEAIDMFGGINDISVVEVKGKNENGEYVGKVRVVGQDTSKEGDIVFKDPNAPAPVEKVEQKPKDPKFESAKQLLKDKGVYPLDSRVNDLIGLSENNPGQVTGDQVGEVIKVNKSKAQSIASALNRQVKQETKAAEAQAKLEEQRKPKPKIEPPTAEVNDAAVKSGVSATGLWSLFKINKKAFGLGNKQALASAIVMDRIVGTMAKRAGTTKSEIYKTIVFKQGTEADLISQPGRPVLDENGNTILYQKNFTVENFEDFISENDQRISEIETDDIGGSLENIKEAKEKLDEEIQKIKESSMSTADKRDAVQELKEDYKSTVEGSRDWIKSFKDQIAELNRENNKYRRAIERLKNPKSKEEVVKRQKKQKEQVEKLAEEIPVSETPVAEKPAEQEKFKWSKNPTLEKFLNELSKLRSLEWNPIFPNVLTYGNGAALQFSTFNKGENELDLQKLLSYEKSKGIATQVMKDITSVADKNGVTLTLYAQPFSDDNNRLGNKDLVNFYKKNGFVIDPEYMKNFEFDTEEDAIKYAEKYKEGTRMIRVPNSDALMQGAQGAMQLANDGRSIIYALTDPNVSTPLHEMAHVYESYLKNSEKRDVLAWTGQKEWNRETSEKFARGFEKWLSTGKAPSIGLKKIFAQFKAWLTEIYNGIKGSEIDLKLNPAMEKIYKAMVSEKGKQASPPSVNKILGITIDKQLVNIDAAVKDYRKMRIKDVKLALNAYRAKIKELLDGIKELGKSGKLTSAQTKALTNTFSGDLLNQTVFDRAMARAKRIIENSQYAEKVSNANGLRLKIRKALSADNNKKRKDKLQAAVANMASNLAKVAPKMVDDIDLYLERANEVLAAIRNPKITDVEVIGRMAADINAVNEYAKDELGKQEQARKDEMLDQYDYLVEAGVLNESMSLRDINKLVAEIMDGKPVESDKLNEAGLVFFRSLFNDYSQIINKMLSGTDPITGEDTDISDGDKELIRRFLAIDPEKVTDLTDMSNIANAAQEFITNDIIDNMEVMIKNNLGLQNVKMDAENPKMRGYEAVLPWVANFAKLPIFSKIINIKLAPVQEYIRNIFRGETNAVTFEKNSGFTGIYNGSTKAMTDSDIADTEYVDKFYNKKPNGKKFFDVSNVFERGIFADLYRTTFGTEAEVQEEFERKVGQLELTIKEKEKSDKKIDQEEASELQKSYDKIVKGSKNINDVMSKMAKDNIDGVMWWIDKWDSKFPEIDRVAKSTYNDVLERQANYTPEGWVKIADQVTLDDDMLSRSFNKMNMSYVDTRRAGTLMKYSASKGLPINDKTKEVTHVKSYHFDINNSESFKKTLKDVYTAPSIVQYMAYTNSPEFSTIIPDKKTRDNLKEKIAFAINALKDTEIDISAESYRDYNKAMKKFTDIARAQALVSVKTPIMQTVPVVVGTAIDLVNDPASFAKGMVTTFNMDFHKALNKAGYGISVRGLEAIAALDAAEKRIRESKGLDLNVFNNIANISNLQLKYLLSKPDIVAARQAWVSYYYHKLKSMGIDTANIDWNTHEFNDEAANYAERKTNSKLNQNIQEMAGQAFASRSQKMRFIRNTVLNFASFAYNMKYRFWTDLTILGSKNSNSIDKADAAKDIVRTTGEGALYVYIGAIVGHYLKGLMFDLVGYEEPEEDKKSAEEYLNTNMLTKGILDLLSPMPGIGDLLFVKGINNLADLAFGEQEKEMPNKEKLFFVKARPEVEKQFRLYEPPEKTESETYLSLLGGMSGIFGKNVNELYKSGKLIQEGEQFQIPNPSNPNKPLIDKKIEYTDKFDNKIEFSNKEKEMMKLPFLLQTLGTIGLGFRDEAETANKVRRSLEKRAKKRTAASKKEKLFYVPKAE